jgi:hypothetical protein
MSVSSNTYPTFFDTANFLQRLDRTTDTPILKGYEICHKYIRGHSGLGGKTPSEAAESKLKVTINESLSYKMPVGVVNTFKAK